MNWLRNHRYIRPFLSVVFLFALIATALAGTDYLRKSDYINDGDTMKVDKPINGERAIRYLGIDSAEMDGDTQEPWATAARDYLRSLLPSRTNVIIRTDVVETDVYGRNLAHVIRSADSLNVNREQLRMGHAVTYVIYPNLLYFEEYRTAQIEAQQNGRGIWDPANPLTELPFEYRMRINNAAPNKKIGRASCRERV